MFDIASRKKFRFEGPIGLLSVEDLWDLPLTSPKGKANLDDIAKGLHKKLNNADDVSFVLTERKSDATVQRKFDIVKHIIDVRMAEDKTKAEKADNAAKKQKLLGIINQREDEKLLNMPLDELRKAVADL